ncbi:hypothetical protein [Pedobacter sp.]|uniref:hypothetical protein n=1 Tax=Pedobacter sp. TaxID=1411316 RepID=UPI003BA85BBF
MNSTELIKKMKLNLLVIFLILFYSCKSSNKLETYKLADSTFVALLEQEFFFQEILNQSLIETKDNTLSQLGQKRRLNIQNYLNELKQYSSTSLSASPGTLNPRQSEKLLTLNQLSGADYKKMLFSLLVDTDQEMIGLHVKAVAATGLKNVDFRNWVDSKIPFWQAHLNDSQKLKP